MRTSALNAFKPLFAGADELWNFQYSEDPPIYAQKYIKAYCDTVVIGIVDMANLLDMRLSKPFAD